VDGHPMGTSYRTDGAPRLTVTAAPTTVLTKIEFLRDGDPIHAIALTERASYEASFVDEQVPPGRHWHSARAYQDPEDGYGYEGVAWTTPVWLERV